MNFPKCQQGPGLPPRRLSFRQKALHSWPRPPSPLPLSLPSVTARPQLWKGFKPHLPRALAPVIAPTRKSPPSLSLPDHILFLLQDSLAGPLSLSWRGGSRDPSPSLLFRLGRERGLHTTSRTAQTWPESEEPLGIISTPSRAPPPPPTDGSWALTLNVHVLLHGLPPSAISRLHSQ